MESYPRLGFCTSLVLTQAPLLILGWGEPYYLRERGWVDPEECARNNRRCHRGPIWNISQENYFPLSSPVCPVSIPTPCPFLRNVCGNGNMSGVSDTWALDPLLPELLMSLLHRPVCRWNRLMAPRLSPSLSSLLSADPTEGFKGCYGLVVRLNAWLPFTSFEKTISERWALLLAYR